jgi:GT2 family glycosyltransferase
MENNSNAGMVCGQLLNQDGSKQNSIASFPGITSLILNETLLRILLPKQYPSKRREYNGPIEVDSGIGACLMVRKKTMDHVGLLDEDYFFFFEETDWARRIKQAGWKIYFVPSAKITHFQGQSVGHDINSRILYYESRYIYFKKWHPDHYPIIRWIIFIRLLVNAGLNLAAVTGTLGIQKDIQKRLALYTQLIRWHIRRCSTD